MPFAQRTDTRREARRSSQLSGLSTPDRSGPASPAAAGRLRLRRRVSLLLLVIHTARLCSAWLPRGRRRVAATTGVPSGWPYYDDTDGEPPGQFCAQDVRILPCAIAFVKVVLVRLVPANALPPVGRVSWTSSLPRPYRRLSTLQRPAALTNSEPSLPELGCLLRMPCNHQSAWRCTDTLYAFCCNPCAPRGGGALLPGGGQLLAAGNSWDRNPCLRGLRNHCHGVRVHHGTVFPKCLGDTDSSAACSSS